MTPARAMLGIAAAALLAGCQQHPDRYDDSGEWHRNGANAANLAAMVADPLDLVRGHGDAGSMGAEAAEAVRQWRNGLAGPGAASTPGSGAVHMGAGMGAGIGTGGAGGASTGG